MHCAKCGNSHANRSHRRTVSDWFLSAFRLYPYRCGACGTRFHSFYEQSAATAQRRRASGERERKEIPQDVPEVPPEPEPEPAERRRERRRKGQKLSLRQRFKDMKREKKSRIGAQIVIYGLALMTFLVLLYALTSTGLLGS